MKHKEFILDRYALNLLSEKEKAVLDLAIADSPTLKADLHLHRLVVLGIQSYTEQRINNAFEQLHNQSPEDCRHTIERVDLLLLQEGFFQVPEQPTVAKAIELKANETDILRQTRLENSEALEQPTSFWSNKNLIILVLLLLSALLLLYFTSF